MKRVLLISILLVFLAETKIQAQDRTDMALYNIGIGSIFGGIGALINKSTGENNGRVFLKGMWQSAIGGYLIYESKNIVSKISEEENWTYSWGAKFVNSAGTSIVQNAASNRDFWEEWHFHFGFNRLELSTKEKFKLRYRIMPASLVLTAITASKTKFEFEKTFQRGVFIFSDDLQEDRSWLGYTLGNILVLDNEVINDHYVYSHELIHVFQYYDYNVVNSFYKKYQDRLVSSSNIFNTLDKIFYFDLQEPVIFGIRRLTTNNVRSGYRNFLELEAEFYARGGKL